jgi:hypothetical protein
MFDPISALRDAAFPVDQLSSAQRAVLAALTEPETAVLVAVQSRLHEAGHADDVVAHELKLL